MSALTLHTATLSSAGGRADNQDVCAWRDGCWVLADGLGGHAGGAVAARIAVDHMLAALTGAPLPTDAQARAELLRALPEITEVKPVDHELKITLAGADTDQSVIAEVLVHGGVRLLELREDEIGLEEVFLRVTRGETQ